VKTYRFHPEAEAELLASVDWYAARDPELAAEFNDRLLVRAPSVIDQ
jgi:plasmid stabilization system protein ParE